MEKGYCFIDGSSKLITCYGVFDSSTTKNTIDVLTRGFCEYGTLREILTDHGTHFVPAWGWDLSHHSFKEFLDHNDIRHAVAWVKHPQTNGKIKQFFSEVERRIKRWGSFH
jgi:putative transposase